MKKLLKHYKPYMARTVIQQIIYRLMVAAIVLLLLWFVIKPKWLVK